MTKELKDWEITKRRRLEWVLTRKGEKLGTLVYESNYLGVDPWWSFGAANSGIVKGEEPAKSEFTKILNKVLDEKKLGIFPRRETTKDGFRVKDSQFIRRPVSDLGYTVDFMTVLLEGGFDLPDELKEPFERMEKDERERVMVEELEKAGFTITIG